MNGSRLAAVTTTAALWLGCAGPGSPGPVSFSADATAVDASGPEVDDVVALTTGLLLAANTGEGELWRALEERLGGRAVRTPRGLVVTSAAAPALTLAVDLRELPACHDPTAGVVVGEPPRVLGCGARGIGMLATFIVVMERAPDVALLVVDGPVTPAPAVAWVAGAGGIVRSDDVDVFDLGVVDAGVLDVRLRLAGDATDLDAVVTAAGRGLAWRGRPRLPQVMQDRARALPRRSWLPGGDPLAALTSSPTQDGLMNERCRLLEAPTSTAARLRCHVLPGAGDDDVIAGLLRAVDDEAIVVEVEASTPPTATPWSTPLVQAIRRRLDDDGVVTVPMLEVAPAGSLCAGWRRAGGVCVSGTPLALHPAARTAVGTPAESIEVQELGRLAARVEGALRLLRRSTEGS